jgi:DNA-binding XRE family transcriptional regulator
VTDTNELERIIKESGLKKSYIAKVVGLSRQGLNNKINNKSPFTSTHISILCDLLKIKSLKDKERIFFNQRVI